MFPSVVVTLPFFLTIYLAASSSFCLEFKYFEGGMLLNKFMGILLGTMNNIGAAIVVKFARQVGFHSTHGWEVVLENGLRHFGLPENHDLIFLFIATFPVVLDTVFKYWIFRYLNQVSPSAVATYHEMND